MPGRWRYVLPNLVTCLSITAAMLSIAEAITSNFDSAAWFALLCVLLDKADGTVARLLGASSRFGIEMDSLSDLIGFGVAPAVLILAYLGGQSAATPLAASEPLFRAALYVGAILYVVAAALRLAKFNVLTDIYGSHFFFGIPTTVCGGLLMSYFLTIRKYGAPAWAFELLPGAMLACALLMVSRIPLPKMGKRKTLFMNIFSVGNVFLVYVLGVLRIFPEYLLAAGSTYLLMGTGWALAKGIKPPLLPVPPSPAPPAEAEEPAPSEGPAD